MANPELTHDDGLDLGGVTPRSMEDSQAIIKRVLSERGVTASNEQHFADVRNDINAFTPERAIAMAESTDNSIQELLAAAGRDAEGVDEVAA